jgi:glutamate-ammonia-ligase adenylyltransferase
MVDAEFCVQFLVLASSGAHPCLMANLGNIALLQCAEAAGLLPEGMGSAAAAAYRELRRWQHHARLNEEPTSVPVSQLVPEQQAIERLWQHVFG